MQIDYEFLTKKQYKKFQLAVDMALGNGTYNNTSCKYYDDMKSLRERSKIKDKVQKRAKKLGKILKELKSQNVDINKAKDSMGRNLISAAFINLYNIEEPIMNVLINSGIKIDDVDKLGRNPLYYALNYYNVIKVPECKEFLLHKGASDIIENLDYKDNNKKQMQNLVDNFFTKDTWAKHENYYSNYQWGVFNKLLTKKLDFSKTYGELDETLLHLTVKELKSPYYHKGNMIVFENIVNNNLIDVNKADKNGNTALIKTINPMFYTEKLNALTKLKLDMARTLLKNGADPLFKNNKQKSFTDLVSSQGPKIKKHSLNMLQKIEKQQAEIEKERDINENVI